MSPVTLGLDLVLAYLIARTIDRAWLRWLSAFVAGLVSVAVAALVVAAALDVPPGQVVVMLLVGAIWSPMITALCVWGFRRRGAGRLPVVQKNRNSYTQWHDQ